MMAHYFILVVVFGVIVVDNIDFVQCVYSCKTHADCSRHHSGSWPYCCGGYMTSVDKGRTALYFSIVFEPLLFNNPW